MQTTYQLHGRKITIQGKPRRISGGYVVTVAWAEDNEAMRLRDGTIHPAHRAGFSWEEPILNIDGYHPFDEDGPQWSGGNTLVES